MSDAGVRATAPGGRAAWLRNLRRVDEQQEDALAADFDARYGEVQPTHRAFLERFLELLPPGGRVLDAACGTGKYFPTVLASGRRLLGPTTPAPTWPAPTASSPRSPPPSTTCRTSPTATSSTA